MKLESVAAAAKVLATGDWRRIRRPVWFDAVGSRLAGLCITS